jgi:hypothetical protein
MNRPRSSSLIGLQAVSVPSPNSRNGLPAQHPRDLPRQRLEEGRRPHDGIGQAGRDCSSRLEGQFRTLELQTAASARKSPRAARTARRREASAASSATTCASWSMAQASFGAPLREARQDTTASNRPGVITSCHGVPVSVTSATILAAGAAGHRAPPRTAPRRSRHAPPPPAPARRPARPSPCRPAAARASGYLRGSWSDIGGTPVRLGCKPSMTPVPVTGFIAAPRPATAAPSCRNGPRAPTASAAGQPPSPVRHRWSRSRRAIRRKTSPSTRPRLP